MAKVRLREYSSLLTWLWTKRSGANKAKPGRAVSGFPCAGDSAREKLEINYDYDRECAEKVASIQVLLVDDHEIARRSVRSVLSRQADVDVICETTDGEEAVRKAEELHPAIILLDITLPGISGIQAARQIRVVSPNSRIIFLSQHDSIQTAKDALSVGAHGYVVKSDAGRDLLPAITEVYEGRTFVSRTLVARGWSFENPPVQHPA
jgi:CheY-like chemotaxis protein